MPTRPARACGPILLLILSLAALAPPAWGVERKVLDQYEERHLQRWGERVAKVLRSDRARLRAELEAAFPDRVADATTMEDYASWFNLLELDLPSNADWYEDSPHPPTSRAGTSRASSDSTRNGFDAGERSDRDGSDAPNRRFQTDMTAPPDWNRLTRPVYQRHANGVGQLT